MAKNVNRTARLQWKVDTIKKVLAGVRAINKAFSANTNCNLTGFSFGHLGSLLKMADAISCTKVGLKFWPGKRPVSPLYVYPISGPAENMGTAGLALSDALAVLGLHRPFKTRAAKWALYLICRL